LGTPAVSKFDPAKTASVASKKEWSNGRFEIAIIHRPDPIGSARGNAARCSGIDPIRHDGKTKEKGERRRLHIKSNLGVSQRRSARLPFTLHAVLGDRYIFG
jgi:hypothetical protein